jgi:hypothetical protein
MTRKLTLILTTACLLAGAGYVLAQQTGPNGGLVGGTGAHQTELVISPTELTVYLIEDGKVQETAGANFRAVVQQGGKTETINLVDQQGKRLIGKLYAPVEKGAVVVLTGKDKHGDQFSARYSIK